MSDTDGSLPAPNLTHAGVTGKVPLLPKKRARGKGKARKLSADHRKHVGQLQKRGMISPKAAASSGLSAKK